MIRLVVWTAIGLVLAMGLIKSLEYGVFYYAASHQNGSYVSDLRSR